MFHSSFKGPTLLLLWVMGRRDLVVLWMQVSSQMAVTSSPINGRCERLHLNSCPWSSGMLMVCPACLSSVCCVLRSAHGPSFYIPVLDGLFKERSDDKWALEFSSAFPDGFVCCLSPTPGGWRFSDCVRCFSPCPSHVSACVRN